MKKFLHALSETRLQQIAVEFSFGECKKMSKDEIVKYLADYFTAYRINVADLKARWPDLA